MIIVVYMSFEYLKWVKYFPLMDNKQPRGVEYARLCSDPIVSALSHSSFSQELPFLLMIGSVTFLSAFLFYSWLPYIPFLSSFCYSLHWSLNKGWSKVRRIKIVVRYVPSVFLPWLTWLGAGLTTSSDAHSSCHSPFQNCPVFSTHGSRTCGKMPILNFFSNVKILTITSSTLNIYVQLCIYLYFLVKRRDGI